MAYGFCTGTVRDPRGMDSHVEIKSHTSGKDINRNAVALENQEDTETESAFSNEWQVS